MAERSGVNWELVRERYEAADLPVAEVARMAGVSASTVYGHARAGEWRRRSERGRTKKPRAARRTSGAGAGAGKEPPRAKNTGPPLAEEFSRAVDDAEAEQPARHPPGLREPEDAAACQAARVARALAIADRLMDRLEEQGEKGRVDTGDFRTLVSGLARLVALERQALGADAEKEVRPPVQFVLEL